MCSTWTRVYPFYLDWRASVLLGQGVSVLLGLACIRCSWKSVSVLLGLVCIRSTWTSVYPFYMD